MRSARSLAGRLTVVCALALLALAAARQPAFAAPPTPALDVAPDVQAAMPDVSVREALRIANGTAGVRNARRKHPDLRPENVQLFDERGKWSISYVADGRRLVDVYVNSHTGKVENVWLGMQAAWDMARGDEGYFGKRFEQWYIWLPLCLLFVAPFFDPRRPFRMLHVDLLVLLAGFGLPHVFFNKGEIGTFAPLIYPVLAYFLARLLFAAFRPRRTGEPLVPFVPTAVLVAGIVLLGGFRIGLDLTEAKVSDVGYGSTVGAARIQDDEPLYVDSGANDHHMDTYGPVTYLAYDPFVRIWPLSQQDMEAPEDFDLPAARAAALVFDALTVLGLFLLGVRLRSGRPGRRLGAALAFGWVSFPYTLFPLMTNGNDTLIAMFLVYALLGLTSAPARGALIALAGAAKFAPLALAPLFATGTGEGSRMRAWTSFTLAAVLVVLVGVVPYVPEEGGLRVFWDQTIGFQLGRVSPFSIWGQNPGLEPLLTALKVGVLALGIAVAFVPRRRDAFQVAALGAAILFGLQLIAVHWFFLYIVWFTPFLLVALFGEYSTARGPSRQPERAAVPAHVPAATRRDAELAGVR